MIADLTNPSLESVLKDILLRDLKGFVQLRTSKSADSDEQTIMMTTQNYVCRRISGLQLSQMRDSAQLASLLEAYITMDLRKLADHLEEVVTTIRRVSG